MLSPLLLLALQAPATGPVPVSAPHAVPPPPPILRDPFVLYFERGSAVLTPEMLRLIANVIAAYRDSPSLIETTGHIDYGEAAAGETLSRRRAVAVRDLLIRSGVPRDHIRAIALGDRYQIISRPDRQNQRVQILLLPLDQVANDGSRR